MKSLIVEDIHSDLEIQKLEKSWNHFLEVTGHDSMFMTFEWLDSFRKKMPLPLHFLCMKNDRNDLIALIPYVQKKIHLHPFYSPRGIVFALNHFGWPSHLDCLCKNGQEEQVVFSLLKWLQKKQISFASFRRFHHSSAFLSSLISAKSSFFNIHLEPPSKSPVFSLPSSMDQFYLELTKSFRKKVRYKDRRLAKEFQVEFSFVQNKEELEIIFEKWVELHSERLQEKVGGSDLTNNSQLLEFHLDFCQSALEKKNLRMGVIKLNGEIGAISYDVKIKNKVYFYNVGFASKYVKYSIGNILTLKCIEKYIQEGVTQCDFLASLEAYKFMWANQIQEDQNILLFPKGPKGRFFSWIQQNYETIQFYFRQKEYKKSESYRENFKSFFRREIPL